MKLGCLPFAPPAHPPGRHFFLPLVRFNSKGWDETRPSHMLGECSASEPHFGDLGPNSPLRCTSAHICPGAILHCLHDLWTTGSCASVFSVVKWGLWFYLLGSFVLAIPFLSTCCLPVQVLDTGCISVGQIDGHWARWCFPSEPGRTMWGWQHSS